MIDLSNISATRWLGLLGFGFAALACARAARRRPVPWRLLAFVHLGCLAEIVVGARHRVHDLADAVLQSHELYGRRESVQVGLLLGLGVLWLAGTVAIAFRVRRVGFAGTLGLAATGAVGGLLMLEIVSLHAVDALMYTRIDGVLAVSIGWALGGTLVGVCALLDRRP